MLLTIAAVSLVVLIQVPSPWIVALALVQMVVACPVIKQWNSFREFTVLHIVTDSHAIWSTVDGNRVKVGLGAMMEVGAWMLIMVQVGKRNIPLVISRAGNEDHYHRLLLVARNL